MSKQNSMKLRVHLKIGVYVIAVIFWNCSNSEYSKLVEREMASGAVYDSLLFGMKFGQEKQEFFRRCWQLNQQGIISNGPESTSVKYELPFSEDIPPNKGITLLFFGDFNEDKIMTGMDFDFYYNAWSIWNKSLQSDKLLPVVMDSLKKWYPGNDFIKVPLKNDSLELLVKVDGNRRIILRPLNDNRMVTAKIDDLRYVLENE